MSEKSLTTDRRDVRRAAVGLASTVLLAIAGLTYATSAAADGGVVVASGRAGALRASVFVSPTPLRAGPSEWSVLLQDAEGTPVLDAEVELELHRHGASGGGHHSHRVVPAHRDASANRLLYTARVALPEPGTWRVALRVVHGEPTRLDFEVPVASASGAVAAHWRALLVAPAGLALFALHQWLGLREARPRRWRPRRAA